MKIAAVLASCLLSASAPQDPAPAEIERAFAAAREASPSPLRLDGEHFAWLAERAFADGRAETDARWRVRWTDSAAKDRRIRALTVEAGDLPGACVDIGIPGCGTSAGGYLNIRDHRLLWQVQSGFTDQDGRTDGFVLLAGEDRLRPVAWGKDGILYDPPQVLWRGDTAYVAVRGTMAGTGAYNADVLYRLEPDAEVRLTQIDNTSWRDDQLAALLPKDRQISKGVAFDYSGLSARAALWRPEDANCCPTGGGATLLFEIQGDRLALTQLMLDPPAP